MVQPGDAVLPVTAIRIERVPVEKLNPAPYNPRKSLSPGDPEYEKLKRSIVEFGLVDPLVWNEKTGFLVGGHQRLRVLLDMGVKEVEVSVVNVTPARERALNVALNKIEGQWDYQRLQDVFEELKTENFDLTLTGFDDGELKNILAAEFKVSGGGDGGGDEAVGMVSFKATYDQANTIRQAIQKISGETEISEGRALELICADFLGGA